MALAWLGVDWGTHSSKWCYCAEGFAPLVGEIWDSRVWRLGADLAMFPLRQHFSGADLVETALKRRLIDDPGQPYWTGERPKLGVTLGQAAVFSLYVLILDAMKTARLRGRPMPENRDLEIRFSHPNWMAPEEMASLRHLRDAAVMAAIRVFDWPVHTSNGGGLQIRAEALREWATQERLSGYNLPQIPDSFEYEGYGAWSQGRIRDIQWRLVFESCAAGFSYLVESEEAFFDPADPAEGARIRKLLVVDIGAGSTDAGYMLRTRGVPGRPLLLWLPAAATLPTAGEWLTDKILVDWRQRGERRTRSEAEDYKTSGVHDWHERPFVKEWCASIADHVAHYMLEVPDEVRLPKTPPLEIAITGGSGEVIPVKVAILSAVTNALRMRGIPIARGTSLIDQSAADSWAGARLAVCRGAAHPWMCHLKHYERLA